MIDIWKIHRSIYNGEESNSIDDIDNSGLRLFNFNKINAKEVCDYLNAYDIKTVKEAEEYVETLKDEFDCSTCNKSFPCNYLEIYRYECDDCKKIRIKKYVDERKSLINKRITNVKHGEEREKGLIIYLEDGSYIVIIDSEDGYDNTKIFMDVESK